MIKKLVIAASLLLLTACDPFEGLLTVNQPLSVKNTEKDQVTTVVVPEGQQNAKLEFPAKDQIRITLKINDKKVKLNLQLPKKLSIPDHGSFSIPAKDLGQDFAAQGAADTRVTDSGIMGNYESCTYQRPVTVCHIVNGNKVCRTEWQTVYGRQYTEFFDRHTDQQITVNFLNEATNQTLANFNGGRSYTERIIRYKGQCY